MQPKHNQKSHKSKLFALFFVFVHIFLYLCGIIRTQKLYKQ